MSTSVTLDKFLVRPDHPQTVVDGEELSSTSTNENGREICWPSELSRRPTSEPSGGTSNTPPHSSVDADASNCVLSGSSKAMG